MLKLKKKLVPILSFVFVLVACCLAWLSFNSVDARADEPKQVVLSEFQFFNTNSEDSQNVAAVQGKYGMLLRFDDVLSDNRSKVNGGIKTVNLINEYGKYIFINDMPLDFYTDAEVCYYYEEYIWVYIPFMDNYRKLSVEDPNRARIAMHEHRNILDALSRHDSAEAEYLAVLHIENARKNIVLAATKKEK